MTRGVLLGAPGDDRTGGRNAGHQQQTAEAQRQPMKLAPLPAPGQRSSDRQHGGGHPYPDDADAEADQCDVIAFAPDARFAKMYGVIGQIWDLEALAIENFILQKDHGIGITNG